MSFHRTEGTAGNARLARHPPRQYILVKPRTEIERANPDTLYRVFGPTDWGNKEKFTDELLKDLIEGFSAIPLGNRAVGTGGMLISCLAEVKRRGGDTSPSVITEPMP